MKMFPVMVGRYGQEKAYIPWAVVEAHAKQAMKNHDQTVERLAERGGLAPCELAAVLEDRDWRPMEIQDAWDAVCHALVRSASTGTHK